MIARRLTLAVLVSVFVFAGVLAADVGSAGAAVSQFGEEGSHSGQLNEPRGVAVNQETGDVYVSEQNNFRIDRFAGSGEFLRAWGWRVNEEIPVEELQTCTTLCQAGAPGAGVGQFAVDDNAFGVAIDNDPLSLSHGDVYVVDWENNRVEKFGPEGEFILMFGGEVNENKSDVCLAKEKCQKGVEGTADGQFEWSFEGSYIAVGPGGRVYVGDRARVQVFEASGVWRESISVEGQGQVTALAVDASGDMFVKDNEAVGVQEFEPDGTQKATQFDPEDYSIEALAVDGSGDLYLGDITGGFHILKYDPAGKEIASFGSKVIVASHGMAFADTPGELYVADLGLKVSGGETGGQPPRVVALTPPSSGPLVEPGSESSTPGAGGGAKLEAQVIPEGNATTYRFEYVDNAHFQASGYASATSTAPVSIGSSFEDQLAEATLPEKTLVPGETYHWRLVATDSLQHTTTGADQTFEELPAALVEGPWAADTSATSVTLAARIDPLGASTSYRLEYGTSIAYDHAFTGNVGEGEGYVPISYHVQELEASRTYHYRLLTSSKFGTVDGADHTFTTQVGGGSALGLPDGRAWELVSPANSGASVFQNSQAGKQAASDGSAIAYSVGGVPLGENAVSKTFSFLGFQVLSRRGPGGWRSEAINPPQSPPEEEISPNNLPGNGGQYTLFSSDLASDAVIPPLSTSFSPEALAGTDYLRNNADGSYTPLFTHTNVWPGTTSLELTTPPEFLKQAQIKLVGGTPDLGHVLVGSPLKLTKEAFPTPGDEDIFFGTGNLYEWGAGRLQLVNRLPETNEATDEPGGAVLAGLSGNAQGSSQRSVSDDGRWVAWTRGNPFVSAQYRGLYVRDMVAEKTVQLGGPFSLYQTMSSDGSHVFFLEKGDLYEYGTGTGTRTELTADHGPGEANAGVQDAVSDVSKDGSYVYFVANGVLTAGASHGNCQSATVPREKQTCNLYLSHDAGGKWSTSYIATLSGEDEPSWAARDGSEPHLQQLAQITSRVSPDGRYLAFMSQRSLTGYDNTDALSGQPDVEAYLYDALTAHLVCASCDPSGARPVGVLNKKPDSATGVIETPLVEHGGAGEWGSPAHWVAGSLPGWQQHGNGDTVYQPRYLSDGGRLFFNSPDALVPQDTNGLEDVYEYEPSGVGDCTGSSATFGVHSGGCVGLISSGTSSSESAFIDASESGDDVFFLTASSLTTASEGVGYHVWDAHVCSASAPCTTLPVSPPPCSSGDSCKPAPSPQPEIFGPSPSATFSGAGNVAPSSTTFAPKKAAKKKKVKCAKGEKRSHGKCVKTKAKSKQKARAKKSRNDRRASR